MQVKALLAGRGGAVVLGTMVERPVVSIANPGGLRTSYEPWMAVVGRKRVTAGR